MNRELKKEILKQKERRSVWNIEIGITSQISGNSIRLFEKVKKWNTRIILN